MDCVAVAEVVPASPWRLPKRGTEGTTRGDREHVRRLTHVGGEPALLEARARPGGAVVLTARAAHDATAAGALERLRFWTGVDEELQPFLERFAEDEVIGASVQEAPHTRPFRRPTPWEVLQAAVCEQLVDDERSQQIKRALIHRHGPRHPDPDPEEARELVDVPDAATVAQLSPAELEACGLAAKRAVLLKKVAREVATGRVDLLSQDPATRTASWTRLRAMPGIGPWTLSILALHGQGVWDALPAGDHAHQMAVGRLTTGRTHKATELEVVDFYAPYRPWRGLAGWHVLRTVNRLPGSRAR